MKIALFPSAFYPNLGGVEELTRQLAHALTRRGHEIIVVSQRWPRELPAFETFEGLPLHRVEFVAAPQNWDARALKARASWARRRAAAERASARIVAESGAELIHIQCAGPNAFYAHHAARALNLPLVLSAQGELTMDATGLYQNSGWMRGVLQQILREARWITACSRDSLDDVKAFSEVALDERSSVIYNGISLADFAAVPGAHSHARPYVFALGRFVEQKGFDVLIRAFARAQLDDYDLILAGDGPQRAALQSLANEISASNAPASGASASGASASGASASGASASGASASGASASEASAGAVKFWGRADRAEVVRLMRGAAWFVLPSRVEPQGIVNLEAMAAGCAVIASKTGGVPEIVLDGETGVLVAPDDVAALTEALRAMATQPERRAQLGAAGEARAQKFDWDALAAQYEAIYQRAQTKRNA